MQFRRKISNTKVFIECYLKFRSSLHLSFFGGHLPVMMLKHDDVLPFSAFQCSAQQSFGSQTQPIAWISKKWYSRGSSTFVRSFFLFHFFLFFFLVRMNCLLCSDIFFFLFFCCFLVTYEWTFSSPKVQIFYQKENQIAGTFEVKSQKNWFHCYASKDHGEFLT